MPLKQCCATGSLHTGTPTGRIEQVHGLKTYVADAPSGSPKGIVVIIPDAFGIALPNNQILADAYAKEGNFQVFLPDFMGGFELPADILISFEAVSAPGFMNKLYNFGHFLYVMKWMPFFFWYCRESVAQPRIMSWFKALRGNQAANLPVGTAGFCWGGKYVTELCWDQTKTDDGKRLVDCGFTAHPSMLKYPGDLEMVVLPLSVAAASIDQQMSPEQAQQTKEVLTAKTAKTKDQGVEHEFVMFEGAHHGFAVRADEKQTDQARMGKEAETQAVEWFKRWFANPPPAA